MASQIVKVTGVSAAFTADGTAAGYATFTSNTPFVIGSVGIVQATGQPTVEVKVVELVSTTQVGLRPVSRADNSNKLGYGRMNLAAYTTAASASLSIDTQQVITDY